MDHFALVVHEQIQCKLGPLGAGGGGQGQELCGTLAAEPPTHELSCLRCRSQRDPAVGQAWVLATSELGGFITQASLLPLQRLVLSFRF